MQPFWVRFYDCFFFFFLYHRKSISDTRNSFRLWARIVENRKREKNIYMWKDSLYFYMKIFHQKCRNQRVEKKNRKFNEHVPTWTTRNIYNYRVLSFRKINKDGKYLNWTVNELRVISLYVASNEYNMKGLRESGQKSACISTPWKTRLTGFTVEWVEEIRFVKRRSIEETSTRRVN